MIFYIYLIGRADNLLTVIAIVAVLSGAAMMALALSWLCCAMEDDQPARDHIKSPLKLSAIVFFISLLAYRVFPSSKTLVAMYVIPKLANNKTMQQIASQGQSDVLLFLQQYEKEIVSGDT